MTPNLKEQKAILQTLEREYKALEAEYSSIVNDKQRQNAVFQKRMDAYVKYLDQQNLVKCLENGGGFMPIADKMGNDFGQVPDFSSIDCTNVFFEDDILNAPMPNYMPYLFEPDYLKRGCYLQALEIAPAKYLLATREYNYYFSLDKQEYTKFDQFGNRVIKPLREHVLDNSFVVCNLDQIVLIDDFYYKRAVEKEKAWVEKKNAEKKAAYFEEPIYARENYCKYYNLPKELKRKYLKDEWDLLSLEQKEAIYLPIQLHKPSRITKNFKANSAPHSFCIMYPYFINPEKILKKSERLFGKRSSKLYTNNEVTTAFHKLNEAIEQKIDDIEEERRDFSQSRLKGNETAFGRSNTNIDLLKEFGVLVKRQDGTVIKSHDIIQIREGLKIFQRLVFPIAEQARKDSLVISHSANTLMYARRAAGMFVPYVPAIGITNKYGNEAFVDIFAHEIAHYIDRTLGKKIGLRYLSDDANSDAHTIAVQFKACMNKRTDSKYLNSKKECFARAFQQYVGVSEYGDGAFVKVSSEHENRSEIDLLAAKTFYEHDNFADKHSFDNYIRPLIEKFIEDNRDWFDLHNKAQLLKEKFRLHAQKALKG
jgi:hypothetical protein